MADLARIAAEFGDDPDGGSVITHAGTVWRWTSQSGSATAWYFLPIDGEAAEKIRLGAPARRGFGSVKVEARVGASTFRTSLFPSKEMGGYLLPLKAGIRKAEGLEEGNAVEVELILCA